MRIQHLAKYLSVCLLLVGTACSGARKPDANPFTVGADTPAGQAFAAWFAGDEDAAETPVAKPATTPERFAAAEIAYWRGDLEKSYALYAEMLRTAPEHELARFAASRIYSLRNSVVDFNRRSSKLLASLDYQKISPLARVYLSLTAQTVDYRLWKASDAAEPFAAHRYGFSAKWKMTPRISPWRLRDFDESFAPQTEPHLADRYLSPYVAKDVEVNYEEARPYMTSGITLYPSFGDDGLYYLETFATVEGDAPQDFLLYGNFVGASAVYVDGVEAMRREEGNYGTGKRVREIRLSPGTHRVLVKFAYQSGYRDWFDLVFIPLGATRPDQAPLSFAMGCMADRELPDCHAGGASPEASVEFLSEQRRPADIEPLMVAPEQVAKVPDEALYTTALAAFYDGESDAFEPAWNELMRRRPEFAAGYALRSEQIKTLWEVPSRLRDAASLQDLRKAHALDPESTYFAHALGSTLRERGKDREVRELLEKARDGALEGSGEGARVRNAGALQTWASYLESQGWEEQAEAVWEQLLAHAPSDCDAAGRLQAIRYGRQQLDPPAEITPEHALCPQLHEKWISVQPDADAERLALREREARRHPLLANHAREWARELWRQGKEQEAKEVLQRAMRRMPESTSLWSEQADRAFAEQGAQAAQEILETYRKKHGTTAWLLWKLAALRDEIPLAGLMHDGREAAMKAVRTEADNQASLSNDDAYFVVDFAARRYFPDKSALTLTHTVVRVMTKGAIDRYGEQTIPGNARVLLARTIKKDGSVRVPEQTSGKSTLSMPGLAEGDFVEIAYLEYSTPKTPPHHIEGVRFFFRMSQISTLHSEYIILGDKGEFVLMNDPPQMEPFKWEGLEGVRFLATNNPRPRSEPRTVSAEEFLPWIQMYRQGTTIGDTEMERRSRYEQILDSSKVSTAFKEQVAQWTGGERAARRTEAGIKELFYEISSMMPDPAINAFGTDISHAVLSREGSTMLILREVYRQLDVPAEIYLVRSAFQMPERLPVREFDTYRNALLRVEVPDTGEVVWLYPDGPDAMFNAIGPALAGQPAICVTCEEAAETTIPTSGFRSNAQTVTANAKLDASGSLQATITFDFRGMSAANLRGGLRSRTDETSRMKFADALASGIIAGSTVQRYTIENETEPDRDLRIVVELTRDNFARQTAPGVLQIEQRLFQEPLARAFASLPQRTTPLMVGYAKDNAYRLEIELPEGFENVQLMSQRGARTMNSRFGNYTRETTLEGSTLVIAGAIDIPIQRVSVADYPDFQKWALEVEQSAGVYLTMRQ